MTSRPVNAAQFNAMNPIEHKLWVAQVRKLIRQKRLKRSRERRVATVLRRCQRRRLNREAGGEG